MKLDSKWHVDAILILFDYFDLSLGPYSLYVGDDPDYQQNTECLQADGTDFDYKGTEAWCVSADGTQGIPGMYVSVVR